MKVLVTGGGGFLGGHVVERLLARGDEVRIAARGRYPELEARGVEAVQGDLAEPEVAERAVTGVDSVVHVAAKAGVWGPYEAYRRANVVATENLVDACRRHGVGRLVYTSTPSVVYGDAPIEAGDERLPYPERFLTAYPETKAAAEKLVLAAHEPGRLHTVALRPHLVFGPRDPHFVPRLVERAGKGQLARVGDGTNRVSVTYVENAAHAHLLALDALASPDSPAGGRAYFINEPEPVLAWAFIERLLQGAGAPPIRRQVSYRTAAFAGAILEGAHRVLGLEAEPKMTRFVAAQLATSHWFKIDGARRDLGYAPLYGLEEALSRTFAS